MVSKRSSPQSLISDSEREDTDVSRTNARAGEQLAETIRTTLGPKGLDKLLITSDGKMVVTNDGASILDRLDIEHPAAKLIFEVAKQQDTGAGDGTTTAVLLAGTLLSEASSLREQGVHPTKIVEGYHLAAAEMKNILPKLTVETDLQDDAELKSIARTVITGKWDESGTDFLSELAVEAVRAIERENRVSFEKITRKTVPGGSYYDSEVINGLAIDTDESSTAIVSSDRQSPSSYDDATIVLIDEPMSIDAPSGVGAVEPESPEELQELRQYENNTYSKYADSITAIGADVVFCQQAIDDPIKNKLEKSGVLAVERTRKDELYKLARATGAQPVTLENLSRSAAGHAATVERRSMGSTELIIVSGFDEFDQVSLLLRGGTERIADETKRKLDDCFYVLKLAIEDEALVPGGGAVEVALATELRSIATTYSGREQLAVEAVADALEIVPRTLARSAGMDPVDSLVELRTRHNGGDSTAGLDLNNAEAADMSSTGTLEPVHVKRQAISGAIEAASLITRIDDSISVPTHSESDAHDDHHDHTPGEVVPSTEGSPWAVGHSMGHD